MLRCVYVVAEAQLGVTLRQAARLLAEAETPLTVELQGFTIDELTRVDPDQLRDEISRADVFLGSMLNSDAEVTLLAEMLRSTRPPATLVFTSQPELLTVSRLGAFDARDLAPGHGTFDRLVSGLHEMGMRLPPSPHALLAAAPRLAQRLDERMLGPLWLYAQAGLYWLNASPENFAQLFFHIASQLPRYRDRFTPAPPIVFPDAALWHPAADDRFFQTYDEYAEWYRGARTSRRRSAAPVDADGAAAGPAAGTPNPEEKRPTVGVIVFRQYVTGGTYKHYEAVVEALEAEGMDVVCGFGGLDNTALVERLFRPAGIDLLLNLTGFNLVGSMGRPQPDRAVELLKSLDIPYLVPFPLLFQTTEQWTTDPIGLAPMQTALQVVMPELEGATEPRVFAGKGADGDFSPAHRQVARLARRVRRWIELRTKPAAERRIAITVFSFPPDKGSVGSAAYLDVFRSVHHLLDRLRAAGCDVDVPADAEQLMRLVLGAEEALPGADEIAVADEWPVEQYKELMPAHDRIEDNFGPAPGFIDSDGRRLRIRGRAFGNVFIGVQPGFGYEGDPMRLLFAKDATPSHSFAAYYAWLEHVWGADAMVHMGTHGALEFMPGKQVGMTDACWPDLLVGDMPHVYFYSMNNPSEATIAKRRSYATIVTYLSPPLREAGLYRSLSALKDALDDYRDAQDERRHRAFEAVLALVEETNLHADIGERAPDESQDEYIGRVRHYVQTLAERLIPVGLHVAGQTVTDEEAAEFLWAALQHPRPERDVPGLPHLIASERGLDWDRLAADDIQRDDVTRAARAIIDQMVTGRFAPPSVPEWRALSAFADEFLRRLGTEQELDALVRALSGRYVAPAPGGDPARVPDALPTGRNLHALDPHRIPSPTARRHAAPVVRQLLDKFVARDGRYPETVACVLWGTDNIKTEGEGVAQVFELIGVEPVPDSLGRMTRLRLIPLEELGRPRIDVVLSVSGIFRDIFPNVMALLDEAVQLAAAADEDPAQNYIRKHALAIQQELSVPFEQAARRLFSNAPGAYGTGVNNVVEASAWETTDDLGDVFVERKGFVFGDDSFSHRPELLEACLKTCTATFQNLDSTEIGVSDVDHYFEYLGGLVAATRRVRGAAPDAFIGDTLSPNQTVRTVEETVRLETRTRLLNPRWYEGMLKHGYQGVHEIATRLDNTFGWSATADAVDEWIYTAVADTFLFDDEMRQRLTSYNPRAVHRMAGRLAEASERGYWRPDEERLMKLRDVLMHAEDVVEGVV